MNARPLSHSEEKTEQHFELAKSRTNESLRECVRDALKSYFKHLGDQEASGLYQMAMSEVEEPLLATVMQHTGGNQTRAARVLGISRSTLRKKLAQHNLG